MPKLMNIRCIVRIRQMLRAWRLKATSSRRSLADAPPGQVVVRVGRNCRRFIMLTTHLNHPIFRRLLDQIEEEYGFANYSGPLWIPCDESKFEQIIRRIDLDLKRCSRDVDDVDRPLQLICGFTT